MNLKNWLRELAEAFGYEPSRIQVREYSSSIADWDLTAGQWAELKKRAKLQFEYFPRISQLYGLMQEIKQESVPPIPPLELIRIDGNTYARRRTTPKADAS